MVEKRLDPEQLLLNIQQEEHDQTHGKLKIYLGAAPGVGKTYAMLSAAIQLRNQGLDVVAGIIVSHGRSGIEELLPELEQIPQKLVYYRDKEIHEFDLDAALHRSPGLLLIDEMAHTNAPGLRHEKRWQDIKELLERGIDVYTTLNVQHIASLSDQIAQIIQAPIEEIVPDSMIELADSIELIDLVPESLQKRLKEGKIYLPEQAELASHHFFKTGNLIALRELALRVTAKYVGDEVLDYRRGQGIKQIWATQDTVLVAVGANPLSLKLIHTAKRIAQGLKAPWHAVYIDTSSTDSNEKRRNLAIESLLVAEQLGAITHVLSGTHVIEELLRFTEEQNVTQLVISRRIRTKWRDYFRRSIADKLIRKCKQTSVHIIPETSKINRKQARINRQKKQPWFTYCLAITALACITMINLIFFQKEPNNIPILLYLLGVVGISLLGKKGPALLIAISSALSYPFFFLSTETSPLTFLIHQGPSTLFTLIVYCILSELIIAIQNRTQLAQHTQRQTALLYDFNRQLNRVRGYNQLIETGTLLLAQSFSSHVIILLAHQGLLQVQASSNAENSIDEKEYAIAQWVFNNGNKAGFGTETLSHSKALYLPLFISQGSIIGVVRLNPITNQLFSPEQMRLIESCVDQLALVLEIARLQEKDRRRAINTATERVRNNMLTNLSHHLTTPLISVIDAASSQLPHQHDAYDTPQHNLYNEIEQLHRLHKNITRITELQDTGSELHVANTALEDLLREVLASLPLSVDRFPIQLQIDNPLPRVSANEKLIKEVFFNLIDNAIKFCPVDKPITVSIKRSPNALLVSVEDCGAGIDPDDMAHIFEKFYRGKRLGKNSGLGIGLSICKKIIKAHGGQIWAVNLTTGGSAFRFTLPIES